PGYNQKQSPKAAAAEGMRSGGNSGTILVPGPSPNGSMNFPSSVWTLILNIKHDPDRVKEQIVLRYRQPVYEFIQRRLADHEDAEDLTQEVFLRVCDDAFLGKVDPEKGRFRTILLAVTRRVIASYLRQELAQRRDRRRQVPLSDIDLPADPPAEGEFDRLWVGNLVTQAMERMKDEPNLVPLKLQMQGKSYKEISEEIGRPETDITNFIHRAKQRLRRELESLIGEYSRSEERRVG